MGSGAILYWIFLVVFGRDLLHFLYAGKYDGYAQLVPWLGFLAVPTSIVAAVGAALRSQERPDRIFWAYVCSTVVAIAGGLPLIRWMGIQGAALGLVGASVTTALVIGLFFWILTPVPRREPGTATTEKASGSGSDAKYDSGPVESVE